MEDKLLTLIEVARILTVHPNTVRNLVKRGVLPVVRVGSAMRFEWDDVREYISDNTERNEVPSDG